MTDLKKRLLPGIVIGLAAIAPPAAASSPDIFGRWVVESGKAVIELFPCGKEACGKLVWLQNPFTQAGEPKRDLKNPDPALKTRPICGLRLVSGLQMSDDGAWEDGTIYSTRDGKNFGVDIKPNGSNALKVRGYVGVSLFGRTQNWRRDDGSRASCTLFDAPGADR